MIFYLFIFSAGETFKKTTANDKEQGICMLIKKEKEGGEINKS